MSNGTKESGVHAHKMQDRLGTVLEAYRGLLRADERRLQEAMLEFERSCWAERVRNAA